MRKIDLNFNKIVNPKKNIMIFAEGTILKPKSLFSLYNHNAYIPIGNAVKLIEDDCKSIGGAWQMCITKVSPEIKMKIKSIVVPEFKGSDKLPEDIELLIDY